MATTREAVLSLYQAGVRPSEIAREVGISRQRVHQITLGYSTFPSRAMAQEIWLTQSRRCRGCRRLTAFARGHVHHLVALKDGGKHDLQNLVVVCQPCHRAIHRGALAVTGWILSPHPSEWPRSLPAPEANPLAQDLMHLRELYLLAHPFGLRQAGELPREREAEKAAV